MKKWLTCAVHILHDAFCYSRLVRLVICLGTDWSTLQWSIEPFYCPVLGRTFPHIPRRLTSLINGTHTNQLPPVSHIPLSVKINHNWSGFDFNSCWLKEAPAKSEPWPWPSFNLPAYCSPTRVFVKKQYPHWIYECSNSCTMTFWLRFVITALVQKIANVCCLSAISQQKTKKSHCSPWALSPGNCETTGITVETLHHRADGGGKEDQEGKSEAKQEWRDRTFLSGEWSAVTKTAPPPPTDMCFLLSKPPFFLQDQWVL